MSYLDLNFATFDPSVITLGSNVGGSNVGGSIVGGSNVGGSNVAHPVTLLWNILFGLRS